MSKLHIVFGESAAGTLRMVLKVRGSSDTVAALGDSLSFGPLPDGDDWSERIAWLDDIDPAPEDIGSDWMKDSADRFLADIRSHDGERLVWIAPRSASEQCGVQYYFEQFPDASAGPMVIADSPLSKGWRDGPPLGLGELPAELVAGLLDEAPRRDWPAERASPELWRRLRSEGALLRIVEEGELRSAPDDAFDSLLFEQVTGEWRPWPLVVGRAMVAASDAGQQVSDVYLRWRLRELARQNRLACEGDLRGSDRSRDRGAASVRRID